MRRRRGNYDLFSSFGFFIPGPWGVVTLLLLFLVGMLLGTAAVALLNFAYGSSLPMEYQQVVSYPLMFIPAVLYASLKSKRNSFFDEGTALDSCHWGKKGWALTALLVVLATLALGYMCDGITSAMPPMPEALKKALEAMTGGNFLIDFISVSILAPIFEEWLCRGEILRGLLNYQRKDGGRGTSPILAILISSVVFALIHMNPWQAVPAFLMGCLFGYVYWRTGSLKLTMLMHFTNNTFSLIISRLDKFKDADSWLDVIAPKEYWLIFAACALLTVLIVRYFRKIPMLSRQGNCDVQTALPPQEN